jgi:hypothetical protein
MLGTAAVVVRGQASAASTYTGRVTGYSPDWYLPLAESVGTTATALIGPNGTLPEQSAARGRFDCSR